MSLPERRKRPPEPDINGSSREGGAIQSARVIVEAGICGHTCVINARIVPGRMSAVTIDIQTECDMVCAWQHQLRSVEWAEIMKGDGIMSFLDTAYRYIRHAACPVPVAALKAVEVAAGVALPADVSISFVTETNVSGSTS